MRTRTVKQQSSSAVDSADAPSRIRIVASGDLTGDMRVLELNRACLQAISQPIDRLFIDVSAVTHSDTKLIAVLISLYANCRRRRIELEWRLAPAIIEWLGIYDLRWMTEIAVPENTSTAESM